MPCAFLLLLGPPPPVEPLVRCKMEPRECGQSDDDLT
jgi:hypothetical protein